MDNLASFELSNNAAFGQNYEETSNDPEPITEEIPDQQ